MAGYRVIASPTRIPVPGGKLIEEHAGRVASGTESVSVAHMVAPPGWGEPMQTPAFLEVTVMVRGRMQVELGEGLGTTEVIGAGQAIVVEAGVPVRYSNPFEEESEYFAVCTPAFSPELAGRDE
ncbi:MAG: cupin [Myxococcota bacterium]